MYIQQKYKKWNRPQKMPKRRVKKAAIQEYQLNTVLKLEDPIQEVSILKQPPLLIMRPLISLIMKILHVREN
ncbi:hypothetical protein B9T28_09265 [Acinetobacter silvestris]|uniref:Uncharacterized protein n=1 Tax=Acinetobacter silvestris TaxID=1977882 RepID=A0A1Y3CEB2_9GAMM|nr:hypothetical protein B9T28_09265 [Acinetobacter silvestris]